MVVLMLLMCKFTVLHHHQEAKTLHNYPDVILSFQVNNFVLLGEMHVPKGGINKSYMNFILKFFEGSPQIFPLRLSYVTFPLIVNENVFFTTSLPKMMFIIYLVHFH